VKNEGGLSTAGAAPTGVILPPAALRDSRVVNSIAFHTMRRSDSARHFRRSRKYSDPLPPLPRSPSSPASCHAHEGTSGITQLDFILFKPVPWQRVREVSIMRYIR
jgi:hypothetical protein